MLYRSRILSALLACFAFALLNMGAINHAYAGTNNADEMQQQSAGKIFGKVTELLEAGGYTYAEVDTGQGKVWAAATNTQLKIGDMVSFTTEMPMQNFHSKSMNRDFPLLYFVSGFDTGNAGQAGATTAMASPQAKTKPASMARPIEGIDKLDGGSTIAELYTDKQKHNGKAIRVRGQVTKVTTNIKGKNWLHIRDSSTLDDLTVITDGMAGIDAIVIVEGKLALDKDFGYGYFYPLIIEDASVTKE